VDRIRFFKAQFDSAQGYALLFWPVILHDIQHLKEHLPVTDVVGHEQDQFAIETIAFF
jgi:hypothetical protein